MEPRHPRLLLLGIGTLLSSLLLLLFYAGWVVVRSDALYTEVHERRRGPYLNVADPVLGFASVPHSGAEERLLFDEWGFRVPVDHTGYEKPLKRPVLLFLGDSFTFGHGVAAEETFPRIACRALAATCLNAANGAYGLAHMVVQARRLIPRFRPDLVIVQYSPWLARRAIVRFAPTRGGKVPVPYLAKVDGRVVVIPPVFLTLNYDLPIWQHGSARGIAGFASFLARVGIPLFVHDDLELAALWVRSAVGTLPPPLASTRVAVAFAYREITRVSHASGAKVAVVILANQAGREFMDQTALVRVDLVVDAHAEMLRQLPEAVGANAGAREKRAVWLRAYGQWKDGEFRDAHPNREAHAIIGTVLADGLRHLVVAGR